MGDQDRELSEEEAMQLAGVSPLVHFSTCVRIRDKENVLIRPVPNALQVRMSEVYEALMELGVPVRMIVLKPRQVGCSTYAQHICYHHGMRYRTDGITISDLGKNSAKLMGKMRDYGDYDEYPWGVEMLRDASNQMEWTNGTKWEIESAENWKAGIGSTRQVAHFCLGLGTMVARPSGGYSRMGGMHVGDMVITHTGAAAKVSYISEKRSAVVRVSVVGAPDLVATLGHRLLVRTEIGDEFMTVEWMREELAFGRPVTLVGGGHERRVHVVEDAGEATVRDFEVDHPDHSFLIVQCASSNSEVPKWPKTGVKNDKRVMAAVMPSMSKGRSVVIMEGTPEGANGVYYETWHGEGANGRRNSMTLEEYLDAREGDVDPGLVWIRVFAAWFEFAEYQRVLSGAEAEDVMRSLSGREKELIEEHGSGVITAERLAWRREIISTECGGDDDVFEEYYPSDDVKCFLVSGRPRFNVVQVTRMRKAAGGVLAESCDLTEQATGRVTAVWRSGGHGGVTVWERPREGMRYLVAMDPASGESQTVGKDPDRISVQVWRQGYYDPETGVDHNTMLVSRVRAPYYGDADEAVRQVVMLSRWYGNALVVPEVNMGLQHLELLRQAGVPLYRRRVPSARLGMRLVEQYGWKLTDKEQRRMIIEALASAIRESRVDVYCPHWLDEAASFVTKDNGRDEAAGGKHDDDILCGAMAYYCMSAATEYRRVRRARRGPRDRSDWRVVGRGVF